jgi:pterin-4a-carbinolamine dehydratase
MSEAPPAGWQVQAKSAAMSRRFEFADYTATRGFLDRLEVLSKETGNYPDLNFAKTHVSVSVAAMDTVLGTDDYDFARRVEALAAAPSAS